MRYLGHAAVSAIISDIDSGAADNIELMKIDGPKGVHLPILATVGDHDEDSRDL